MTTWDYKEIDLNLAQIQEAGREGWEVVAVYGVEQQSGDNKWTAYYVLLKRPLERPADFS